MRSGGRVVEGARLESVYTAKPYRGFESHPLRQAPPALVSYCRMRGLRQWKWHLDEVYVKINGEMRYLWRAVDQEGEVLEGYVTKTRDKAAALCFIKKALKRHGTPEAIITDGLRCYKAAMSELSNADK